MSAVLMTLGELLDDPGLPDIGLAGLAEDSRAIEPGEGFIALKGSEADGHAYAAQAVERGAVCVLAEHRIQNLDVPVVEVAGLRARRGALAARLYGYPSRKLRCVGVTGTNGKTSIAHHVADLAGGLGWRTGYLGTLGWGELGDLKPAALTTADAVATQKRLARLRDQGCAWACLEASSHALAQGRVDDVDFEYALFSNLTRDHLDYHADFAAYGAAKRRLFEFPSIRVALVNVDDPFGRELAGSLSGAEVITIGRGKADLSWDEVEYHQAGLRARLSSPWGQARIEIPAFGEFALANVAAAIGVLAAGGLSFTELVEQAQTLAGVPGRMEFFRAPGRPTVVVDYAHTPDALSNVLAALARHCPGRLICVIGCGGNRDAGKRPLMAQAAASAADTLWLTSDNPRWEDPCAIIDQMRAGLGDTHRGLGDTHRIRSVGDTHLGDTHHIREEVDRGAAIDGLGGLGDTHRGLGGVGDTRCGLGDTHRIGVGDTHLGDTHRIRSVGDTHHIREEVDRAAAIAGAIDEAGPQDLVLIAGKGHETRQEIRGCRKPFSDREAVRLALGGAL